MNKENIQSFIEHLEKSKTFSMHEKRWDGRVDTSYSKGRKHLEGCGSPACIVGHFKHWKRKEYGDKRGNVSAIYFKDFFGISVDQCIEIYKPRYTYADSSCFPHEEGYITKGHALRMLKKLLKTGEVDWKGTKKPQNFDIKTWLEQIKPKSLENIQKQELASRGTWVS